MAASSLEALKQTHTVQVEWRAYELRPAGSPPISPEYLERIRAGQARMEQIARERFGLEMREPQHIGMPGATRPAHIGAKLAEARGVGEAYHQAMFRAYWQEDKNIAEIETLLAVARSVGLDEAEFHAALDNADYRAQVEADEYWAYQQGLGGVPAFIFGNRYLVSGAQPVEVLRQVADKCVAEGRTV